MVRGEKNSSVPEWIAILLREKFFVPCSLHQSSKKNEKTFFCLCCHSAICFSCFSSHRSHALLQIRRYVYHEVIRLGDAEKLLNCSLIQPYTTNSAKVVFLKHRRPKTKTTTTTTTIAMPNFRRSTNLCITCFRTLQYPYLFCSLSCKVNGKIEINKLQHKNYDHRTPASIPITILSTATAPATATATTIKLVKKKHNCVKSLTSVLRRKCLPVSDIATVVNRRKGVPQRSPLS